MSKWGSKAEREIKRRILVSIAALAYEEYSDSIISDEEFDMQCLKVDLDIPTGNEELDNWFRDNFDPSTGMWVHNHPHKEGLHYIYQRYYLKWTKKKILTNNDRHLSQSKII